MRYPSLLSEIETLRSAVNLLRSSFRENPRLTEPVAQNNLWSQLTACLDALGATIALLNFYHQFLEARAESEPSYKLGTGELFMNLYGVLQGLFVQQDALRHLAKALGTPLEIELGYPGMARVREIRNLSIGHPTKKGRIKEPRVYSGFPEDAFVYARVIQDSLARDSFALEVSGKVVGETRLHHLQPLIIAQLKEATSILRQLSEWRATGD
jgi:hypothetical protein